MNERDKNLQEQPNPALNIASVSKSAFVKTYVLTVSRYFPKTHKRAGEPTYFTEKIACGVFCPGECNKCEFHNPKIHTIRANYDLWENRARQINEGKAILSIRYWSGTPYRSKQVELYKLEEIGLQKLEDPTNFVFAPVNGKMINWEEIAKNDGLSFDDFCDWFKVRSNKPMAIIHFTDKLY